MANGKPVKTNEAISSALKGIEFEIYCQDQIVKSGEYGSLWIEANRLIIFREII